LVGGDAALADAAIITAASQPGYVITAASQPGNVDYLDDDR